MSRNSLRAKWNTANARLANKPFDDLFKAPEKVEPPNTGLQSDGGDASPKTLICGWCGNHRKGELSDGVRCSCGGNSWLICTLGCLEHEQPAAAKA